MSIKIPCIGEDGQPGWLDLDKIKIDFKGGVTPTPPDPDPLPDPGTDPLKGAAFYDRFLELSIEDGQAATRGARWADSFPKMPNGKFGVRRLAGGPNLDQGVKRFIEGKTHEITENGLMLLAGPDKSEKETGYIAGMISAARSFSYRYGSYLTRYREVDLVPATHFSDWLLDDQGNWPPEIDKIERIGSNSWFPDGPMDMAFFNSHGGGPSITMTDMPPKFFSQWRDLRFDWTPTEMVWSIDGKVYREQKNYLDRPMYPLLSIELGGDESGNFPGSIRPGQRWPCKVEIAHIAIWTDEPHYKNEAAKP